jgi:Flp pilus assembly protein TadB
VPTDRNRPTTETPEPLSGLYLALAVWIILAVVNLLVVVVDGAIWAIFVAVAALVMAVITFRHIQGLKRARRP